MIEFRLKDQPPAISIYDHELPLRAADLPQPFH